MSDSPKTFRLGGAGGYSIRAIGHASTHRGQSPVYERIQLWRDEPYGYLMRECHVAGMQIKPSLVLNIQLLNLSPEDETHLTKLFDQAWKRRAMQGESK